MMAYVTSILAGIAAATPLLTSIPHQYQAFAAGVIATAGALYHLFQPVPVSKWSACARPGCWGRWRSPDAVYRRRRSVGWSTA
jgi:hypothetical protein